MTDLERLWDDYPAGTPPVREILATAVAESADGTAGATAARRRRIVVRPLLTAAAVTGLVGALVGGALVSGGDGLGSGSGSGAGDLPRPVAFVADLAAAGDCDELLASYVDRGLDLVTAWGWGGSEPYEIGDRVENGVTELDGAAAADAGVSAQSRSAYKSTARVPRTERQVNSETGTNVQEAAVDEPDSVKTDGKVLAVVRDDELRLHDVTGPSTEQLSTLDLPGVEDAELLLDGDTLVVVGADQRSREEQPGTRVLAVSIADPARPEVTEDVSYDAALLSARQHGSTVRLVLSSGLPDLDFVEPTGRRGDRRALQHNRKTVEDSTIEDWLPAITTGTGDDATGQQLLDCTSVAIPDDELGLDTVSVVGFEASSPDEVDAIGLAGATDIAYESADQLYLATGAGWDSGCFRCVTDDLVSPVRRPASGSAHLFAFDLDGTRARHVASGEVEGSIRDRWSIDAADGVLRAAVGPTSETADENAVVTFEQQGERLVERGRLGRLGPDEDIKSVRWFDDLAIVVTFREVDPLYAVDLTDTAQPRLLGKLKVPGFSSYLHPLGSWRMIGVGEGPDGKGGWGAQVGLFDVRDVTEVRRLDVHTYGRGTEALAGLDPRAFTWLPDRRTVITVLQRWTDRRIGYVSVLELKDGKLHDRLVRVEYGDDVDQVRAVPMPDGRVVVVTGEKAEFFALED